MMKMILLVGKKQKLIGRVGLWHVGGSTSAGFKSGVNNVSTRCVAKITQASPGWRNHWRRGLVEAVQDRAQGSREKVSLLIAELAVHFECIDAVGCINPLLNPLIPPTSPTLSHTGLDDSPSTYLITPIHSFTVCCSAPSATYIIHLLCTI